MDFCGETAFCIDADDVDDAVVVDNEDDDDDDEGVDANTVISRIKRSEIILHVLLEFLF